MFKMVVADDEFYARKALIRKIHMAEPEAVILADFENGEQTLEYIREHKDEVDVLLTDVKMPEMDGLELSKYVSEEELGVEVLIVSGYNEFEYAKKAMAFGVSNYITKPVQTEELEEAFDRIRKKTKKYEEKVQDRMSQRALEFLSIPELAGHEEWRKRFLLPLFEKYPDHDCYLAVLQKDHAEEKDDALEKEIDHFVSERKGNWFYFRRYQEYALLLFLKEKGQKYIETDLQNFLRKIKVRLGKKMTAGLSQKYTKISDMKKAYQEAVYAMNQRLIEGWVKVYAFQGEVKPFNHFTEEAEVVLQDAITKQKCEAAKETVSRVLEKCRDAYSLYITISGIFNLLYRIFCKSSRSEEKDTEHAYMLFSYKSDLYMFKSFEEVHQYVNQIVESMCQEQEDKKHHYIVAELLDYIERNYQGNISLSELAEHKYFMNSSYLSRLFKNEVGQTFSKYLMEYRIQKAAGLLENQILKINDVAMLVGYNDVSHFIQYFRKFYNCTPEEYRNKRLKRQ